MAYVRGTPLLAMAFIQNTTLWEAVQKTYILIGHAPEGLSTTPTQDFNGHLK